MWAYAPEHWTDFAEATAGALAALAGLLFVAVSINLQVILGGPHLPGRAAQTLIQLATPVLLSLVVLVPGQGNGPLGVELIGLGVATGLLLTWLARPARRVPEQPTPAWIMVGVVPALTVLVTPVLAGVGLLTESVGGLYWLPVTVLVALIGGLINAWALLVEILR